MERFKPSWFCPNGSKKSTKAIIMDIDNYKLKIIMSNSSTEICNLKVAEVSPEIVELELDTSAKTYKSEAEYNFEALQKLRKQLESDDIQLLCNGSVKNVYPSPMMMSMGGTRAYVMTMGKHASLDNQVDIFNDEIADEYATVDEQNEFYEAWINTAKVK